MTTPTKNEQLAQNSAPEPLAGYALAFDGTLIKKSCETCTYYLDGADSYQLPWYYCDFADGNSGMDHLPNWPFKNGCKHFELHSTFAVDWEAVAREEEAKYQGAGERSGI